MTTSQGLKTFVLGAWAAFFMWLLISGKVKMFIGPRTYWVVVLGAVCLTLATIGQLFLKPSEEDARSPVWWVGYAAMLFPILLVLVVPEPNLGSLAASRKSSGGVVSAAALQPAQLQPGEEVSFQEIAYALESEEYAAGLGVGEGYEVDLTGFVSANDDSSFETFALTRFSIFCCAADAVPYTISVRPPDDERYRLDEWLRVRGILTRDGDALVVSAETIEAVAAPDDPYI